MDFHFRSLRLSSTHPLRLRHGHGHRRTPLSSTPIPPFLGHPPYSSPPLSSAAPQHHHHPIRRRHTPFLGSRRHALGRGGGTTEPLPPTRWPSRRARPSMPPCWSMASGNSTSSGSGRPGTPGRGPARAPTWARSGSAGRCTSWGRAGAPAGWYCSSRASACGQAHRALRRGRGLPRAHPQCDKLVKLLEGLLFSSSGYETLIRRNVKCMMVRLSIPVDEALQSTLSFCQKMEARTGGLSMLEQGDVSFPYLIELFPMLLLCSEDKHLKPLIVFFEFIGIPKPKIASVLLSFPPIILSDIEKDIKPTSHVWEKV